MYNCTIKTNYIRNSDIQFTGSELESHCNTEIYKFVFLLLILCYCNNSKRRFQWYIITFCEVYRFIKCCCNQRCNLICNFFIRSNSARSLCRHNKLLMGWNFYGYQYNHRETFWSMFSGSSSTSTISEQ